MLHPDYRVIPPARQTSAWIWLALVLWAGFILALYAIEPIPRVWMFAISLAALAATALHRWATGQRMFPNIVRRDTDEER